MSNLVKTFFPISRLYIPTVTVEEITKGQVIWEFWCLKFSKKTKLTNFYPSKKWLNQKKIKTLYYIKQHIIRKRQCLSWFDHSLDSRCCFLKTLRPKNFFCEITWLVNFTNIFLVVDFWRVFWHLVQLCVRTEDAGRGCKKPKWRP